MKFSELFEMSTYIPRELPVSDVKLYVVSADTLDREFTTLGVQRRGDANFAVALKKDYKIAIIGRMIKREADNKFAIEVMVTMKFHINPDLGEAGSNGLQIDIVESIEETKGFGLGYNLYKTLLNNGYTLVSDNVQYIGGRELWKKIVRYSAKENHNVFIMRYGKYLRDDNEQVIRYDGSNIPDSEIWSTDKKSEKHYYTLLVAKNI